MWGETETGTDVFGGCTWNWKVSGRRTLPKLSWQNGVVREISLGLTFNFTVDEVLNEFGLPEAVSVIEGGTPENWYWVVDMFYPQTGIQVKVYTPNFSSVIEPSTEVGVVVLFSPSSLENLGSSFRDLFRCTMRLPVGELVFQFKFWQHE